MMLNLPEHLFWVLSSVCVIHGVIMSVFHWIIISIVGASAANNPISKTASGEFKTIYHEKSRQRFSLENATSGALFGYSIAYQEQLNSLIVGSPRESLFGEVHLCPIKDTVADCEKVHVQAETTGIKEHFWFGATVNAGKSFFMACAPRFIKTVKKFVETRGACFSLNKLESYSPKLKMLQINQVIDSLRINYERDVHGNGTNITNEHLSDSFGWSSYVNEGEKIFVGGPAMSVGRVEMYRTFIGSPTLIEVNNEKLKERRVSFNFGYSIAKWFADDDQEIFGIGTPYGGIGYGRVHFYKYYMSNYIVEPINTWLEGEKAGILYGASLCAVSRNDTPAFLVGAPVYSVGDNSRGDYDTGAVYVYTFNSQYTDDEEIWKPILVRKVLGYRNSGYFGAAIVSIGDFDKDEIDEIAISAPYEDDHRGAVYIYSGAQLLQEPNKSEEVLKGSQLPWLQRILPEVGPDQYFGLALHAPADADKNGCKELAIGAPGRNYVNLLRCTASVNISFHVIFPDLKNAITVLTSRAASFSFEPCLNVVYHERPDPKTIETNVNFEIKLIHPHAKMQGANPEGAKVFKVDLKADALSKQFCREVIVELPKNADYDRDILFNMSVALLENPIDSAVFNPRQVLVNKATRYSETFVAPPIPGSNLSYDLQISMREGYIIGSTENETITISVNNTGGTAYGVCLRVRFNGVPLSRWPLRTCSKSDSELRCTKDLLLNGETWKETVDIAAKELTSVNEKMEISAELWTSGCSKPTNKICDSCKVINFIATNNISVRGVSSPGALNVTKEELQSVRGKYIDHIYSVFNLGVTTWKNITCEITLPHLKASVFAGLQECKKDKSTGRAICVLKELKRNIPELITIQMEIRPESSITEKILTGKATLDTSIIVTLRKSDVRKAKIMTEIRLKTSPGVPFWMILLASLVGIFIVGIICWILHQFGFLQRKNHEELEKLKENVKRQSMRRSMMLRQSTIEVSKGQINQGQSDDTQQLIKIPEHEENSDSTYKDPARAAFEQELARALSRDDGNITIRADVH